MSRHGMAVALTVAMPGLGHLALGWVRRGLAIWATVYATVAGLVLVWAKALFVPWVPAVVLAAAWLALQAALWRDLARLPVDGLSRRPPAHPWVYVIVFACLGVWPVVVGTHLINAHVVGVTWVAGDAMFPALLAGDQVVYDRAGFGDQAPPQPGDLVVVDLPDAPAAVARVVAVAGQTVERRAGRLIIDGAPVRRLRLSTLRVPHFDGALAATLASLDGYLEELEGRAYVVCDRPNARSRETGRVRLGPGELFVVGDNRAATEAPVQAKVGLDAIRGAPRFVWASYDREGARRPGRGGLVFR